MVSLRNLLNQAKLRSPNHLWRPSFWLVSTPRRAICQLLAVHPRIAGAAGGGVLARSDLDRYIVADTDPVRCACWNLSVVTAAPPSSGGIALGFHSVQAVHLTAEAERHAYADRNIYLGDPDFVVNPTGKLLAHDYAAATRAQETLAAE